MTVPITADDLDALRAKFRGDTPEEIDWEEIGLPPCSLSVWEMGARFPERRVEITESYYAPTVVTSNREDPDREIRRAGRRSVVVASNGVLVATWKLADVPVPVHAAAPSRRAKRSPAAPKSGGRGPGDHAAVLRMLAVEGYPVELTGSHHLKVTLPGGVVFLPSTPSEYRGVRNAVTLMRRYGATLRHDS